MAQKVWVLVSCCWRVCGVPVVCVERGQVRKACSDCEPCVLQLHAVPLITVYALTKTFGDRTREIALCLHVIECPHFNSVHEMRFAATCSGALIGVVFMQSTNLRDWAS